MADIPLEQPKSEDIYSFGFNRSLNRGEKDGDSVVYNALDQDSAFGSSINPITSAGDIVVGKIQASSTLAPFHIRNDSTGSIHRVGSIRFASAGDMGIDSLGQNATANKVIYALSNDLRVNSPTTASIVSLDTNGAQRVLVGVIKTGLTDAGANSIFEVALTAGSYTGGTIEWTCVADDGTDYQTRAGITTWAAVNKGGTYTTDVDEIGSSVAASAAGTLTGTWSILTGTNKITLQFTPTSSLTPTTLSVFCTIKNNNGGTITRV